MPKSPAAPKSDTQTHQILAVPRPGAGGRAGPARVEGEGRRRVRHGAWDGRMAWGDVWGDGEPIYDEF